MSHFLSHVIHSAKRVCALSLCTALLFGMLPLTVPSAQAAWEDAYLSRLVSWNIMRGDQNGNLEPGRAITRAEFASMLNRTFGYHKTGAQPFRDVRTGDWFYDDISIAYTAGYFKGTSNSTASPDDTLTREEAATMLCRNLMLQPQSGEDLSFTDSRKASSWSRGYIKAAAEKGILTGDPEGTFRPLDRITRGEVATMLVRVIGTPIQSAGTYSNSVSGNLMVSTSGVTLENMTVTGDLYITPGVGLGYVTLNNVTVYGQIIASGAGESNKGDASIILKNCTAPEMIVDSPTNQYVTIRTVGNTDIDRVYIRTNTYLEGKSTGRHGFDYVEVDGEEGTQLDLAGNMHEVVTMSPKSTINVGSGTVEKLTVDENAVDSKVTIAQGAVVEQLNLDTGTTVTGKGDIGTLYVNAPGCTVEMLPDVIIIRPGITANIDGITMDSTLADQMSDKPRILSGYPRLSDVAPNQAKASFMTNKPGTLYWAVRLSGDGAFDANDLIKPPSYGGKIVKSGNLSVKDANDALSQKITGLQPGASYVLSAVLVDARDDRSTVKSVYFTTPDNSKPNFASGYPRTSTIEDTYVTFDVAATKTCTLYWAIYKKGMPAPTANDFKDGSLSGAISSGKGKLIRSEEDNILMGNKDKYARDALAEVTEYDAYFFLTDTVNDSAVKKISVKTADRTPPVFRTNYPRISKIDAKALTGESMINEDGKVYWAIVKHGTENYPQSNPDLDEEAQALDKKLQIKGGMYALKSGSFNAKQDAVASFNMSGLDAETAYDIYFVAEDTAGNLSEIATILNAKTLDSSAPELVELRFSQANDEGIPLANTDVTLVFSEDIYSRETQMSLSEMFASGKNDFTLAGDKDQTPIKWVDIIRGMFTFNNMDNPTDQRKQELELGPNGRQNITVKLNEEGQTEVTFANAALKLQSGATYQFVLNNITDSSNNVLPANTKSQEFRVLDAQVDFNKLQYTAADVDGFNPAGIEASFSMVPYANSTENVPDGTKYDLLIASDTTISFKLYRRDLSAEKPAWEIVTDTVGTPVEFTINKTPDEKWTAASLNRAEGLEPTDYPQLNQLVQGYEYAVEFTSINLDRDRNKWDATVNLYMYCVAGSPNELQNLTSGGIVEQSFWDSYVIQQKKLASIGNPSDFTIDVRRVNQNAPQFMQGYPRVAPGDSLTRVDYMLDREADVYYVVAPVNRLEPDLDDPGLIIDIGQFKDDGDAEAALPEPGKRKEQGIRTPTTQNIMSPSNYTPANGYQTGKVRYGGTGQGSFTVEDLQPNQEYYIYFVLKGSYKDPSPVWCYKFNTSDVVPPVLTANSTGDGQATFSIKPAAGQTSVEAEVHWLLYPQATQSGYPPLFSTQINGKTALEMMESDAFDKWSSDTSIGGYKDSTAFKEALWEIMQGGSDASPAPDQNGAERNFSGTETVIDKDQLQNEPTKYLFIVAAKNELGGLPVFRVVKNIQKVNRSGPLVKSMNTTSTYSNNKHWYNGTVTINFDTELYVFDDSMSTPEAYIPTVGKNSDLFPDSVEYVKLSNLNPTRSLGVKFNNFVVGDSFTITPTDGKGNGGYFSNKSGYMRTDGSITFTLQYKRDSDGNPIEEDGANKVEFVLSDGTTSETDP